MHCASSTSIDSTSNSLPLATVDVAAAARRAAERRDLDLPLALARAAAQRAPSIDLLLEPRSLAHRPSCDELEVERERVGDDLAQAPDAQLTTVTRRPAACLTTVLTIAPQRESSCTRIRARIRVGAELVDRLDDEIDRALDHRADLPDSPQPDFLDIGGLARDHDDPARATPRPT